jgi:hypothetical protein
MRYPIFREPGYRNTSNPFVGRLVDDTQGLVTELEELCGPEDTIISSAGRLVHPLMYRRALSYNRDHVRAVSGIAQRLRNSELLGGIIAFTFEEVEIKRQRDDRLFAVRALLGGNVVRSQMIYERRFVQEELPPYAATPSIVTRMVRIAETPSYAFGATVIERLHAFTGMTGEFMEPAMLFTQPYVVMLQNNGTS